MNETFKTVVDVNMWISLFEELRMMPAAHHREALTNRVGHRHRTENLRVMAQVAAGEWGEVIATQHVWDLLQAKLRESRFGASEQEVQYFLDLFTQIILATGGKITVRTRETDPSDVRKIMRRLCLPDEEDTILVISAFDVGATTILTHDNHLASCGPILDEFNKNSLPEMAKPDIVWKDVWTRSQRSANGEFLRVRRIRFHQNRFGQVVVDHRDRTAYFQMHKSAQARLVAEWKSRPENIL